MSFETLNAENRNAGFVIPVRRCCSFCRNPGHNISTCNDERLYQFEQTCINNYRLTNSNDSFKNWLMQYSIDTPNTVKAYAIRFCGCSMRTYMHICIEYISIRIRRALLDITRDNSQQEQSLQSPEPSLNNTSEQRSTSAELLNQLTYEDIRSMDARALINLIQNRILQPRDILIAMMFMDMINQINNSNPVTRQFNIERRIVECSHFEYSDCNICYDNYEKGNFVKLNCGHEFCKDCMKQTLKNLITETPQCAFCRAEIKNFELSSKTVSDEFDEFIV